MQELTPIGYMSKKVASGMNYLSPEKEDVYSVSGCISENFTDYVNYWKHNGYWFFDSPKVIEEIAQLANVDLSKNTLFYYEAYTLEFDETSKSWRQFSPNSFPPEFYVQPPKEKRLEGFDVVTFFCGTNAECSPLSCNHLVEKIPTNRHCLFDSFEEAKTALETGLFENSEPGPYRIFAVFSFE
jgi:hypothetical protein